MPGIGPKTRTADASSSRRRHLRCAWALVPPLRAIKGGVAVQRLCHITEQDVCELCSDPAPRPAVICVVEQPRDLAVAGTQCFVRGLITSLHASRSA